MIERFNQNAKPFHVLMGIGVFFVGNIGAAAIFVNNVTRHMDQPWHPLAGEAISEVQHEVDGLRSDLDEVVCLMAAEKDERIPWESCIRPTRLTQWRRFGNAGTSDKVNINGR